MRPKEWIAVLDFGSQYAQLIARRVREANVYSEIFHFDVPASTLAREKPAGIIMSGGPASTLTEGSPRPDPGILKLGIPALGICYGLQVSALAFGGAVTHAKAREYGGTPITVKDGADLLAGVPESTSVWMSHGDMVTELDPSFEVIASTPSCRLAAVRGPGGFFGVQFHPEVTHTPDGRQIIQNFLYRICGCTGSWRMSSFIGDKVAEIGREVGDKRVILGLSGGVDSSVAAALLHKALGDRLTCIFVDNGLLRKGEVAEVVNVFRDHFRMDLRVIDAIDRFIDQLEGVKDPEQKRKIIGRVFIEVFEEEARKIPGAVFLAQGTLYPDVIESVAAHGGPTAKIKSHHNVGGLPEKLGLKLVEPLRFLFKDEVRRLGRELGLPQGLVMRHPFPGPGLGVRVLGAITREKLKTLRQADEILISEMKAAGLYEKTSQAFVVLLPVESVGVMGDERTYENAAAIRVVETEDFMTADWSRLPYDFLAKVSSRIINEVRGINRVVYDVSTKPPSTIEWE